MSAGLESIVGTRPVEVEYEDGRTEMIEVRQIAVKHIPEYSRSLGDAVALLALATRRSKDWVQTLSISSFNALKKLNDEMNTGPLVEGFRLDLDRLDQAMPGTKAKVERDQFERMKALEIGSPGSASKPDGTLIG